MNFLSISVNIRSVQSISEFTDSVVNLPTKWVRNEQTGPLTSPQTSQEGPSILVLEYINASLIVGMQNRNNRLLALSFDTVEALWGPREN